MRANDFMMREEITITAERTVGESTIPLLEPRTGGLPVADEKNHSIDVAGDLNTGARPPAPWLIDVRNTGRASRRPGGMQTEGQR